MGNNLISRYSVVNSSHRTLFVLAGDSDWGREQAMGDPVARRLLWVTGNPPEGVQSVTSLQARQLLGGETGGLVFDAHSGFDPDAFGAVLGTVSGGGVIILLCPDLQQWPEYQDPEYARIRVHGFSLDDVTGRFLQRLVKIIQSSSDLVLIEQKSTGKMHALTAGPAAKKLTINLTNDQQQAIEAVMRVSTGHRRRPVVLIADRGRGKSAAMGIAAARLLQQGVEKILVTAPRLDAADALFRHARQTLPGAEYSAGELVLADQSLKFIAPDALLLNPQAADLLLVDEAAAIPAALLTELLEKYPRIAFATTVHGYEGTGRGFAIRFRQVLDKRTPQWREVLLQTPIRWGLGDPVEQFVFRALLLNAEAASADRIADASKTRLQTEFLARDKLVADEALLSQLFGLLVNAHYRTTPMDLRYLLDGPNISVWAATYQGAVVAAALVAREGGFDEGLAEEIWCRRRRPRGHLLPQTLAAQAGLKQAAVLTYDRVIRIAVHPAVQGRGIGTDLLRQIEVAAQESGCDLVGSSFGATADLLSFWRQAGFYPVRLGMTREASSGSHSVAVLYPITPSGQALFEQANDRFVRQLPELLSEPLSDLDAELAGQLMSGHGSEQFRLDDVDLIDLEAFVMGYRGYGDSLWVLRRFALMVLSSGVQISRDARVLLVAKLLQRKSWASLARQLDLAGKSQVVDALRRVAAELLADG